MTITHNLSVPHGLLSIFFFDLLTDINVNLDLFICFDGNFSNNTRF